MTHERTLLESTISDQLPFLAENCTADCLMIGDNFDFAD